MSERLPRFPETHERHLFENKSIVPEAIASIPSDDVVRKNLTVGRRKGEAAGAAVVATHAKEELMAITGLDADHVSAVLNMPDGWHVTVDLVELRRIPAATDVLASYEAVLGPTGVLLSYHRIRRYFRDQMLEES
jgi:hypothetical protein